MEKTVRAKLLMIVAGFKAKAEVKIRYVPVTGRWCHFCHCYGEVCLPTVNIDLMEAEREAVAKVAKIGKLVAREIRTYFRQGVPSCNTKDDCRERAIEDGRKLTTQHKTLIKSLTILPNELISAEALPKVQVRAAA